MSTGAIWQRFCRPFMIALRFEKTAKGRTICLMRSLRSTRKMDETAGDPRDPEAIVNAFLQHKSMKQMQDYLARGRRFAEFDVERLNKTGSLQLGAGLLTNIAQKNE